MHDQEAAEWIHYRHIFFIAARDSDRSEWVLSVDCLQIVSWHGAKFETLQMMSLEWLSREGDQYLLYLHLQHNIPSFICANEGESVVVYPNISSVILRDEPEIHAYHTNLHSNVYQHQQSIVEAKQSQNTLIHMKHQYQDILPIIRKIDMHQHLNNVHRILIHLTIHQFGIEKIP